MTESARRSSPTSSPATLLAHEAQGSLLIDGPLQYDAAANETVARQLAPNSLVAGKATVFVFPGP